MDQHFHSRAGHYDRVQRFMYADDLAVKRSNSKTGCGGNGNPVSEHMFTESRIGHLLQRDQFPVGGSKNLQFWHKTLLIIGDIFLIIVFYGELSRGAKFEFLGEKNALPFIMHTCGLKGGRVERIYKNNFDRQSCEKVQQKSNLIEATVEKMKNYIIENYAAGDKIISNELFAKMFGVSIRTVNEAAKILNEQNIILSRRGRYGTIYLNDPQKVKKQKEREEKSLFMSRQENKPLQESYLYSWEKTLDALKKYIIQNHGAGDKIPSMKELALILNVSTNTIRHAIQILCDEGYLITQRGKYGGVYILEMPQKESKAFRWLALNPTAINVDIK